MKTKKEDILWKINSPDTLQLWPKSSRECYISPPFLPEEFVSDANGIFAPKNGSLDILGLYGIKNAAFTTHRSQYYSERVEKKFPTIIYTLRGTAKVSFAGTSHALKKGSVFLSATGSSSVLKAGRCWDVLWFHIKECSEWENILGRECLVKQSILADSVASAAKIYAREIYSREPSVCVLENAAVLLCALLRKEFSKNDSVCAMITHAIGTAEKFPCRAPSACKLAKSLSISVYELNKACCKRVLKYLCPFKSFQKEIRHFSVKVCGQNLIFFIFFCIFAFGKYGMGISKISQSQRHSYCCNNRHYFQCHESRRSLKYFYPSGS